MSDEQQAEFYNTMNPLMITILVLDITMFLSCCVGPCIMCALRTMNASSEAISGVDILSGAMAVEKPMRENGGRSRCEDMV